MGIDKLIEHHIRLSLADIFPRLRDDHPETLASTTCGGAPCLRLRCRPGFLRCNVLMVNMNHDFMI